MAATVHYASNAQKFFDQVVSFLRDNELDIELPDFFTFFVTKEAHYNGTNVLSVEDLAVTLIMLDILSKEYPDASEFVTPDVFRGLRPIPTRVDEMRTLVEMLYSTDLSARAAALYGFGDFYKKSPWTPALLDTLDLLEPELFRQAIQDIRTHPLPTSEWSKILRANYFYENEVGDYYPEDLKRVVLPCVTPVTDSDKNEEHTKEDCSDKESSDDDEDCSDKESSDDDEDCSDKENDCDLDPEMCWPIYFNRWLTERFPKTQVTSGLLHLDVASS
jgi:hypothetical protein